MVDIITRLDDDLANRRPVLLGDGIRFFGLLLPIPSHVTCAHLRVQATGARPGGSVRASVGATASWDAA